MEKLSGGKVGDYEKKIIACAHGFAGEGKSTFMLTFPSPLHILNCGDRDLKYLLDKLPGHIEIYYEWMPFDVTDLNQSVAKAYLKKATDLLAIAMKNGGTFAVDAHDLLWEITQTGLISGSGTALRYKDANEWMFSFWGRSTTAKNLQVVTTALATEIWDGPSSTGRYRHGGWKHIDRYIETDIRMFHKEQMTAGVKPVHVADPTVTHCGYIEASKKAEYLNRRIVENPTFAYLYKATYGEAWPDAEKLWTP